MSIKQNTNTAGRIVRAGIIAVGLILFTALVLRGMSQASDRRAIVGEKISADSNNTTNYLEGSTHEHNVPLFELASFAPNASSTDDTPSSTGPYTTTVKTHGQDKKSHRAEENMKPAPPVSQEAKSLKIRLPGGRANL